MMRNAMITGQRIEQSCGGSRKAETNFCLSCRFYCKLDDCLT